MVLQDVPKKVKYRRFSSSSFKPVSSLPHLCLKHLSLFFFLTYIHIFEHLPSFIYFYKIIYFLGGDDDDEDDEDGSKANPFQKINPLLHGGIMEELRQERQRRYTLFFEHFF